MCREEQRKENYELMERIRQLEANLQEEKDKTKERRDSSKGDENLQNAKAENKRKDQEIKKLKTEVNKRNDEQTRLQLELKEQKTTNTNLNRLLEDVKKVNKKLELDGAPRNKERKDENIEGKKQVPCKYFQQNKCKYGEKCLFKHEKEVCKFFEKNGWCRFKEDCRYSHLRESQLKTDRNSGVETKILRKVEERMTFLERRLNKLLTLPKRDNFIKQNSENQASNSTYRPTYAEKTSIQPTMTAMYGEQIGNQPRQWNQPNITNAAMMNEQMSPNLHPLMMTNQYQTPYRIETQIRNDQ